MGVKSSQQQRGDAVCLDPQLLSPAVLYHEMGSAYIRARMKSELGRESQFLRFLRRLKADGRSNMYGAVPDLMTAFGLDRQTAFGIVCEWLDRQAPSSDNVATRRTI
jgi:hypothetical protein